MIVTELYKGQGLGNQLACYVTTRVIAADRGYAFGVLHKERCKALDFLHLDFGEVVAPQHITHHYTEKSLRHPTTHADIRTYDSDLVHVSDDTKLDGVMQGEQYFAHRKDEIRQWLSVDLLDIADNVCIINFRGGEYVGHPELFLEKAYWENAIRNMQTLRPDMEFKVVTDDVATAKKFFPDFEISHNVPNDYISIQSASYLILSNSSFAFFPAWLNSKATCIIAPKYWARHNVSDGYWSAGYNITNGFTYQDRDGNLSDYETCMRELKEYMTRHPEIYNQRLETAVRHPLSIMSFVKRMMPNSMKHQIKYFLQKVATFVQNIRQSDEPISPILREEIKEYRKTIKLYDVFTYNGEADVLDIRLNILYDHVDEFIIVEAPTTFSGLSKPLYFREQKERFAKFADKITYFVIDDYPNDKALYELARNSSNIPQHGPEHWIREFYQKESIKKALVSLRDDDICFVGDVDEIWNPEVIIDYRKDDIFKLRQDVYSYFLNNKSSEPWAGTLVTKYKNIKDNCLNHLRTKNKTKYTYIQNAGWHFTNMGGLKEVKRKLNDSYTDESYKTKDVEENLEKRFGEKDYLGRGFTYIIDETSLPRYVITNKETYKNLFK
jgi:hypothetical protein